MTGAIIKERYYILTPLSFLLGALVLIATLLLAVASYLRSIDKTMAGYGHLLTSIDATLIHDMVQDNQRQLGVLEASITLSAGGARYPDDAAALLERADECLYQSKRQGRDCWHLSATQDPPKGEVVTVSV